MDAMDRLYAMFGELFEEAVAEAVVESISEKDASGLFKEIFDILVRNGMTKAQAVKCIQELGQLFEERDENRYSEFPEGRKKKDEQ